jgi:hypothetical protein
MITRTGKIAQLPKPIRDDLNHRLQNGKQGPELLKWLNSLPETQELITTKFDHQPINRQNLTEWRQGGYEDWLRHQEREQRIQRLAEEGTDLEQYENEYNLFESSAHIALAELMVDLDSLPQHNPDQRWNRLRELTRELARLQNAYNRSRWAELAWSKWNERFLGPEDYDLSTIKLSDTKLPDALRNTDSPSDSEESLEPETSSKTLEIKPDQPNSTEGETLGPPASRPAQPPTSPLGRVSLALPVPAEIDDRVYIRRTIYHPQGCDCVCRTCHPEDSDYPYAQALQDHTEAKERGVQFFWRGRTGINTRPTKCNCPCEKCEPAKFSSSATISPIRPLSPISETVLTNPNADFLRKMAHLKSARQ